MFHSLLMAALVTASAVAPASDEAVNVKAIYPELEALYVGLHRHPEVSSHEVKTAARMASQMKKLGFQVTTGVGGNGLVAVLRNGAGPTVLVRTDLDALPVTEMTGLPYASQEKGAMHACGHDVHMTAWVGTAELLLRAKSRWQGTLVFMGQPAEETGSGARAMLKDGLLTRFPKPDFALALHDSAEAPAGKVVLTSGFAFANVDMVNLTLYGRGGHGAFPHKTVDPIVLAARVVLALQTIVSRENDPLEPAVITVGSIHGGTKHNIIPDEVQLQLTVRSFTAEVRAKLLSAIQRTAKFEALAVGAPKEPAFAVVESSFATYNDPAVLERLRPALVAEFGEANLVKGTPVMGAEDFSELGRAGIPAFMLQIGAQPPNLYERARKTGEPLPSLHSALFAPDREPTIQTAVRAMTRSVLTLLRPNP